MIQSHRRAKIRVAGRCANTPGRDRHPQEASMSAKVTCSVEGCIRISRCRGWCDMHYCRWKRTGDPGEAERRLHPRTGVCSTPYCLNPVDRARVCSMHYYRGVKGRVGWVRPARRLSTVEIAWLAGLFEGEGCISVKPNAVRLVVGMTDEDVVRRCRDVTGAGTLRWRTPSQPGWKPQLIWSVGHRRDVSRLLLAMAPLLGERRRSKALQAAEKLASMPYRS